VCIGWAGRRSHALGAQGSAAYMSCTYFGSALISWLGGYAYDGQGWLGITVYTGALQLIALATGLTLWRLRAAARPVTAPA
jgi:predicted MFS family arabinose efflux permease